MVKLFEVAVPTTTSSFHHIVDSFDALYTLSKIQKQISSAVVECEDNEVEDVLPWKIVEGLKDKGKKKNKTSLLT